MLVLSRKQDQEVHVPQFGIKFRVLGVDGKRVRIGIDAPRDVRIIRSELEPNTARGGDASAPDVAFGSDCAGPPDVHFDGVRSSTLRKDQDRRQFARNFETTLTRESRNLVDSISQ